MTAYIDRIVTEVVVQPERSDNAEQADQRWLEKQKVAALLKAQKTQADRISAEGLDD